MKKYTVVGYYRDTFLNYVGHHSVGTPEDAARSAWVTDGNIEIVAVFEGVLDNVLDAEYLVSGEDDL